MSLIKKILRILFKISLWLVGIVIVLFAAVWITLKFSAVQTFIIGKATHFVEGKTHTKVSIGKVDIGFPKSIILEEIFLNDLQKDTLLSLQKLEVDVNMLALINKKVDVNYFLLRGLRTGIYRKSNDTTYNYQFLISAFSNAGDTLMKDTLVVKDTANSSPWKINVNKIELVDCKASMLDSLKGSFIHAFIGKLLIDLNELDLEKQRIDIDDIDISNTQISMLNTKNLPDTIPPSKGEPWKKIIFKDIQLSNVAFSTADSTTHQVIKSKIGKLALENGMINLTEKYIKLSRLQLNNSDGFISMFKQDEVKPSKVSTSSSTNESSWSVSLKNLQLESNNFEMHNANIPHQKAGIDYNHLALKNLQGEVNDVFYEGLNIKADVKQLLVQEKSGLGLQNLQAKVRMTPASISVKSLDLKTNNSILGHSVELTYASLDKLMETMQVSTVLEDCHFNMKDLLLLQPALAKNPFIKKNQSRTIDFNIIAKGSLEYLPIQKFNLNTGNTSISLAGNFKSLSDPNKLYMDLHLTELQTGAKDLYTMLPNGMLPTSISIPASINIKGNYVGSLDDFVTKVALKSSYGQAFIAADIKNLNSKQPVYNTKATLGSLHLGKLLKQSMLGKISGKVEANGRGFDIKNNTAHVKAHIASVYLKDYNYKKFDLAGSIDHGQLEVNSTINDTNLAFILKGKANINKGQESYEGNFNLRGADLKNLHLSDENLRVSAITDLKLSGSNLEASNGFVNIRDILIIKDKKKYKIDSLLFATINEKNHSNVKVSSSLLAAKFDGNINITKVPGALTNYINKHFHISDVKENGAVAQKFDFEIQLNDAPVLYEVLLPSLEKYTPGPIKGSFDSEASKLAMSIDIPSIIYAGNNIQNFKFELNGDDKGINYSTGISGFAKGDIKLEKVVLDGTVSNNLAGINLQISEAAKEDEKNKKVKEEKAEDKIKLMLKSSLENLKDGNYKYNVNPDGFMLEGTNWGVAKDNYIQFGKDLLYINQLNLSHEGQSLSIQSSAKSKNSDLVINFKDFHIQTLSKIAEQNDSLVRGLLNGTTTLYNYQTKMQFQSQLDITKLTYKKSQVGTVKVKADNANKGIYNISAIVSELGNDLKMQGYFNPNVSTEALDFNVDINKFSMSSIDAFTAGQLAQSEGFIQGNIKLNGSTEDPQLHGNINFNNVITHVNYLNEKLFLNKEHLKLDPAGIYFESFTIRDSLNNTAILDGAVKMKSFSDLQFDLSLVTNDFLALNTTAVNNKLYYGKVVLDSKIHVTGNADLPIINADIKIGRNSNFTYAIPESKVSADKGEGVVEFIDDWTNLHQIMKRKKKEAPQKSQLTGFQLASVIRIGKSSTLKVLVDPIAGDSLVVNGRANLNLGIDPAGNINLTGTYELEGGSYKVSLKDVLKKEFEIAKGSTITWNGDPMDAIVDLTAQYEVRTSAADLMQQGNVTDSAALSRPIAFHVLLILKGALLKPEISFRIDMPEREKQRHIDVYNQLAILNANESELNKQVFSLLILNKFISSNVASGGGTDMTGMARSSVSKIMSEQLNKLSSQYIKGVELNFDVQSYNDQNKKGNTEVQVGLKKQVFDNRLSIQVGGNVNVEGKTSNQGNITGDVVLEYRLTKKGRYRLKAFRQNQVDAVANGVITQTGVGLIYSRDYNRTKELFSYLKKNGKK